MRRATNSTTPLLRGSSTCGGCPSKWGAWSRLVRAEMGQRAKPRSMKGHTRSANDVFLSFTSSVHFDHRLWKFDIAGSIAHASTLADGGILTKAELERMVTGLRNVAGSIESGEVELDPKLDDAHMNIGKPPTDRTRPRGA